MSEHKEEFSRPIDLGDGQSVIGVWIELNSAMKFWAGTYASKWRTSQHMLLTNTLSAYREQAAKLQVFPARRWEMILDGVGWTSLSISLLSWCKNAELEMVLQKWRSLGEFPETKVAQDFPALLLNPAFSPGTSLRSIISTGRDATGVAVLLAATLDPVIIDIPEAKIAEMPFLIREMIAARVQPHSTSEVVGMFNA